jgi:hypothetical protein
MSLYYDPRMQFMNGICKTPERGRPHELWFWAMCNLREFPNVYHHGFTATSTEAYAAIRAKTADLSGGSKVHNRGAGGFARSVLARLGR